MTASMGTVAAAVEDARLLLDYAVSVGKDIDRPIAESVTGAQKWAAGGAGPAPAEWAAFATKYAELARVMAPVTAATLRATSDQYGRRVPFMAVRQPSSEAKIWSRKLWFWTVTFAVAIVFIENYNAILHEFFAVDEYTSGGALRWHVIGRVLAAIVPFVYGGLGAAAFLLRSAHGHLHSRTFDPNHIPEYYSRMLLVIAGGAIQLLITQVADDTGVIKLSAAALAFVAGYNSDLLFSTVERISAALLPKVGVSSMRPAEPAPITGLSVQALLEQLDKAQSEEAREVIRGLLGKIKERV